ncbi:MAG: hypothetical protein AAFX80_20270 [Cyanobacteria bacterium J06639_18]
MKIMQSLELLVITMICVIFLQELTGCGIMSYTRFSRPTIFAGKSIIDTTKVQELNHHLVSEDIVQNDCPKWDTGGRRYNTKTVETIKGKVLRLDYLTSRYRMSDGLHLQFQTTNEVIPIHLGSYWYLENQEIEIKPNDTLKIIGSRISFDGQAAIIAAQIKKGETTVKLRDKNGFPMWSGRRKQKSDWNKEGFPYLCKA